MANITKIKIDGVEHQIGYEGLHNQYCTIEILDDNNDTQLFKILLQTFKPITTLAEFKEYVRNTILPTSEPDYSLHALKLPIWANDFPDYLVFVNAYYGDSSCSISQYIGSSTELSSIISSTNISVVIGRIQSFTVQYTIIS